MPDIKPPPLVGIPIGPAGGDLGGSYPNPAVIAVTESGGPTSLAIGSIPDGQTIVRSGATLVGVPSSSTDQNVKASSADTTPGTLEDKINPGTGISRTIVNPGADEDYQLSVDYGVGAGTAVEGNDLRVPVQAENDALQGTDGTPSNTNRYVTNSDPRNSDSRAPSGAASNGLAGSYPGPTVNGLTAGVLASDAAHGNRGGGSLHALAIAAGAAGFFSGADKTKLDGLGGIQTLFIPSAMNANGNSGDFGTKVIASNAVGYLSWFIPLSFVSLVSLDLIFIPTAAAAGAGKDIDLFSDYAAVGELSTTHSEADTTSVYNLGTTSTLGSIDVSDIFSSLSANDHCGLQVKHNSIGGTNNYLGVVLRFNT